MNEVLTTSTDCPECGTEMDWTECSSKLCVDGINPSGKTCWMCDGHGGYLWCPKCGELRLGARP